MKATDRNEERQPDPVRPFGIAGKIAQIFVDSKLTPLIIVTTVLLGLASLLLLPREEEPQIKVPMVDVIVSLPGFSPSEVEDRATRPMEKLLWEIPGVEYIYSTSSTGQSLVIVRFKVGQDLEQSLVKLNQKLQSNFDRIPPGVSFPLIKPRVIDDVPILALTLHSAIYDHLSLRRLAAEVEEQIKQVPLVAETKLIGGAKRQLRVLVDPTRLAARGLSLAGLVPVLQQANRKYGSGTITSQNQEIMIETGAFLSSAEDVSNVVAGIADGKPIYLKDVAEIGDQSEDPSQYVLFGTRDTPDQPAVTITVAKRPGANAIAVANQVLEKISLMKGSVIPSTVEVSTTRNYGETAAEKSNELLMHMAIAVVSVSLLILFALGWRESVVVAIAIPSTLALTLLVFYLGGFTLNRITLFALIFSIGILVDDAIVVVENIVRHAQSSKKPLAQTAVEAVAEVGNPTILATFAVIAAVLPMASVGGLMGPYMRPIPIGASAAMLFSLLIAFIVTPWAASRVLSWGSSDAPHNQAEGRSTLAYRKFMSGLISSKFKRHKFLVVIVILLLVSLGLVGVGLVKVKMLPFDNKSEFQIIINAPESSSLENTTRIARQIAKMAGDEAEVLNYQIYAGIAAPFNFNGLVRHYFMRAGSNLADIQVNLVDKSERSQQSHQIAKRVREKISAFAKAQGVRVAVSEVPPGPPVLQTLVAEIYGEDFTARTKLGDRVKQIFGGTPGVVDLDWYEEAPQKKILYEVDREKSSLHGISAETVAQTLRLALGEDTVDLLHVSNEKEDIPIVVSLPRELKTDAEELLSLRVRSGDANRLPEPTNPTGVPQLVSLRELVRPRVQTLEQSIYHKNLMPVSYVIADVAGVIESPVYAILRMNKELSKLDLRDFGNHNKALEVLNAELPFSADQLSLKWDGEWHITIEVFRDLGLAFIAVLILIYFLMVGWFKSFVTPLVVMTAIPFSLIGILPAHGILGAFFTATSMIGFMAGAGIVVRNSIILVDFIELGLAQGLPLEQAIVDAGALRFRPMALTAMAVVVGASVILFDPIFQGLAISLMAGEVASLLISRMAVPVLYYLAHTSKAITITKS